MFGFRRRPAEIVNAAHCTGMRLGFGRLNACVDQGDWQGAALAADALGDDIWPGLRTYYHNRAANLSTA